MSNLLHPAPLLHPGLPFATPARAGQPQGPGPSDAAAKPVPATTTDSRYPLRLVVCGPQNDLREGLASLLQAAGLGDPLICVEAESELPAAPNKKTIILFVYQPEPDRHPRPGAAGRRGLLGKTAAWDPAQPRLVLTTLPEGDLRCLALEAAPGVLGLFHGLPAPAVLQQTLALLAQRGPEAAGLYLLRLRESAPKAERAGGGQAQERPENNPLPPERGAAGDAPSTAGAVHYHESPQKQKQGAKGQVERFKDSMLRTKPVAEGSSGETRATVSGAEEMAGVIGERQGNSSAFTIEPSIWPTQAEGTSSEEGRCCTGVERASAQERDGSPCREDVLRAQGGDGGAFEDLVRQYSPLVRRVAYQILGDLELAEDVVQDTFLKVHLRLGFLKDPSRFRPWLCRIAANRARDILRQGPERFRSLDEVGQARELAEGAAQPAGTGGCAGRSPAESSEVREFWARVSSEVGALPKACRTVAQLRYLDSVSQPEIAGLLRIDQERVKTLNRRARGLLQERLRTWQPEGQPNAAV